MPKSNFPGEYHLVGVHEMASAFNFTPDGKFQFYYIYGAVDRNAEGTYNLDGDTLRLKSDKAPGKDFTIKTQRKEGSGYTIQILDANKMMAKYVMAIYFVNGEQHQAQADDNGYLRIDSPNCEKIYLQHILFPDILSLIKDESNTNNYFELTLNPSLGQVSFMGVDFVLKEETLTCAPNYFMPMDNIRFVKSKSGS